MKHLFKYTAAAIAFVGAVAACTSPKVEKSEAACFDEFDNKGVMVRHNTNDSVIHWLFSADSLFEGGPMALDVLKEKNIKASFFYTGKFLRDTVNHEIISRTIADGHYVGGHSNHHIQLADWDEACTPLVTVDSLLTDVLGNFEELAKFGVPRDSCRWFMPPYEWIAKCHVPPLCDSLGLKVINPTPCIQTFRDYTTPDMPEYHSSDSMLRQLYEFEREHSLNGAFIIIHLGTQDVRTDKLYHHLPSMIDSLSAMGYHFDRLR